MADCLFELYGSRIDITSDLEYVEQLDGGGISDTHIGIVQALIFCVGQEL